MFLDEVPDSVSRWMCFIDGENLTARGQRFARDNALDLKEGPFYSKDVFLWLPGTDVPSLVAYPPNAFGSRGKVVRSYYYTSLSGDQVKQHSTRLALRSLNFQPEVFLRGKDATKSKGLDLTIARDILSHGFRDNYDLMILIAGDGDYVPLLDEVKRLGKISVVAFFQKEGLNPDLRLAADYFVPIDAWFVNQWLGAVS